jgi:hypothetical protein
MSDFNIDSTIVENQQLIDDIFGNGDKVTSSPNDVKPIESQESNDTDTPPGKKEDNKQKSTDTQEDENWVDKIFEEENTEEEEEEENTQDDENSKSVSKKNNQAAKDDQSKNNEKNENVDGAIDFNALSKDFFDLGIFTREDGEEEGEISTPEKFIERMEYEKKKSAEKILDNFLSKFGQDYVDAFDAIFVKGVNPKEYFQTYNEALDYSTLDLSIEKNQELIVRKALQEEGYDEEDIEQKIEKLKDYHDLEDESRRVQKVVVKKQQQKLEEIKRKKEIELQREAEYKERYNNSVAKILNDKLKEKEFDGIPINPSIAKDVNEFITVDKWQLPDGKKLTDFDAFIINLDKPENFELKVKLATLVKIMEKDPSLNIIKNKAVTKEVNNLFKHTVTQKTNKKPVANDVKSRWNL